MAATQKVRVDVLLVERGLVPSRERARALILAGRVLVDEQKVEKPGISVGIDVMVRLLGEDQPFVSRGGIKLAAALDHGRSTCSDVPASMWALRRVDLRIVCCNAARRMSRLSTLVLARLP